MAGLHGDVALLREVIQAMPMAVAVFDRDMRYLAHNTEWITTLGEPARDLVGLLHYEVFDVREEWREAHRRGLAGLTEDRHEDFFDTRTGLREYLTWRIAPWHDAAGEIAGILIFGKGVTERVALERKLTEQETLIAALFEQAPVGLNLCTLEGLWVRSNPAFLSIIGYTQEEADGGLTYWQLTPRTYDAAEEAQLELLRTTGHYGPYEKEFIRKDGSLVPVRLTGFLVERQGGQYIWSLIEDLTAQRALETRLEHEQIKAIHAAKLATMGEMAAGFAHEINNPLGIIDAYAYTLADAVQQGDTAHVTEAIAAIRDAITRAGAIVHGLRRFARERDDVAEVSIPEIVEEALTLCRARIRTYGVVLEVDLQSTSKLRGHKIELAQVLVNLINNAFDANRETSSPWIRVTARETESHVELRVADSGPGVPPDVDVFRTFFTTKPAGVGTGLGLSISRSIIERHGGRLTLERADPTTFLVELPR